MDTFSRSLAAAALVEGRGFTLPGVGTLEGRYVPARIDHVRRVVEPPTLDIAWTRPTVAGPPTFAQLLVSTGATPAEAQAAQDAWLSALEAGESIGIGELGSLVPTQDAGVAVDFLRDEEGLRRAYWGGGEVAVEPLPRRPASQTVAVQNEPEPSPEPQEAPAPEEPSRLGTWVGLGALALASLARRLSKPNASTDVDEEDSTREVEVAAAAHSEVSQEVDYSDPSSHSADEHAAGVVEPAAPESADGSVESERESASESAKGQEEGEIHGVYTGAAVPATAIVAGSESQGVASGRKTGGAATVVDRSRAAATDAAVPGRSLHELLSGPGSRTTTSSDTSQSVAPEPATAAGYTPTGTTRADTGRESDDRDDAVFATGGDVPSRDATADSPGNHSGYDALDSRDAAIAAAHGEEPVGEVLAQAPEAEPVLATAPTPDSAGARPTDASPGSRGITLVPTGVGDDEDSEYAVAEEAPEKHVLVTTWRALPQWGRYAAIAVGLVAALGLVRSLTGADEQIDGEARVVAVSQDRLNRSPSDGDIDDEDSVVSEDFVEPKYNPNLGPGAERGARREGADPGRYATLDLPVVPAQVPQMRAPADVPARGAAVAPSPDRAPASVTPAPRPAAPATSRATAPAEAAPRVGRDFDPASLAGAGDGREAPVGREVEVVIILGSFGDAKNAGRLTERLAADGLLPFVDQPGKLTRVGVSFTATNPREVDRMLTRMQRAYNPNAWVLE